MQCQKHKDLLERWWNDRLTEAERAKLEAQLTACEDCRRELEGNRELWDLMGYVPVPEPSGEMQAQFNAMLESYKATEASGRRGLGIGVLWRLFAIRPGVAAAFSMVLLLGGFGLGMMINRTKTVVVQASLAPLTKGPVKSAAGETATVPIKQTVEGTAMPGKGAEGTTAPGEEGAAVEGTTAPGKEVVAVGTRTEGAPVAVNEKPSAESKQLEALTAQVHEMRELMMLSLLQNPSASERIRAVSYTSEIRHVNPNIAAALLATLNNDPNVNVRLTTLEALTHFVRDPVVREGLIQSILQQDSPLVQAALADVMLKLQEKRAIVPFKKLLQQKDLNGMVRTKIEQTITRLT
ncbi:MAG TPA: HEAT repeat domain-containing protein [Puia sp.]|jgi:hypothetical protein|nr:HEAT repeat domain-containing protein [Puia sp.]